MHYDRDADDPQPWEEFLYSLDVDDGLTEHPTPYHSWQSAQRELERAKAFESHFSDLRFFPTAESRLHFAQSALARLHGKYGALLESILENIEALRDTHAETEENPNPDFIAACNNLILRYCPEQLDAYDNALNSNLEIYEDIQDPKQRRRAAEAVLHDKMLSIYCDTTLFMTDWLTLTQEQDPDQILDSIATLTLRASDTLKPSYFDALENVAFDHFWRADKKASRDFAANAMAMCLPPDHARHLFWNECHRTFAIEELFAMEPEARDINLDDMKTGIQERIIRAKICSDHLQNIRTFVHLKKTADAVENGPEGRHYPDEAVDALLGTYLLCGSHAYAEQLTKMYHEQREDLTDDERDDIDVLYTLLYGDSLDALAPAVAKEPNDDKRKDLSPRDLTRERHRIMAAILRDTHGQPVESMTPTQRAKQLLEVHDAIQLNASEGSHLERFAQNRYAAVKLLCLPAIQNNDRHDTDFVPGDAYRYQFRYGPN